MGRTSPVVWIFSSRIRVSSCVEGLGDMCIAIYNWGLRLTGYGEEEEAGREAGREV